ncbi:MAG: hypothetical protein M1827_007542 [Pycnora praestabilis]|nr:MAG: hypothetical protein M1827_007542 [Pycnora praestabilis]
MFPSSLEVNLPYRDSPIRSPGKCSPLLVRFVTNDELSVVNSFTEPENGNQAQALETTSSLEGLQSAEQRNVLNIVDQLRKCGLESTLSLPQLVVCGDQSAGKSSVLEALTEVPFPRNDNLCTRFATEIILRRAMSDAITIKVIPDDERPQEERDHIEAFKESIWDFEELPSLMDKAMTLMGINNTSTSKSRAFAKDVLSIEIEGPSRPQLTLVDLPGLIQTQTRGVTEEDVQLVTEITDHYISQHRTICLAVVSASNDYANQGILKKVRRVDREGDRTLGIITKPDRLSSGSGSEKAFIGLARNEDIFFKLGWHVLKNRNYEEGSNSFEQRNVSEVNYFRKSNFSTLPRDCVGISSLRDRLSELLFNHVKQELPKLRKDLEEVLKDSQLLLEEMGDRRATPQECKAFLTQLSLDFYEVGKAAVNGHYEGEYFTHDTDHTFSVESPTTIRRLRAVIQYKNCQFSNLLRTRGYKYHIGKQEEAVADSEAAKADVISTTAPLPPIQLSKPRVMDWVRRVLVRTRGKELPGNFNPLLIGELFWEQSSKWQQMAEHHVEIVADVCNRFLDALLREKCPKDVYTRLWTSKVEDALKLRLDGSASEMEKVMEDIKSYPITYNHYYTDTIKKRRREREEKCLARCIDNATQHVTLPGYNSTHTSAQVDSGKAARDFSNQVDPDMENHSCEEALDCLYSIYKLSQKTFIDNITTQVVERHIVRGLEKIFSPIAVNGLSDTEAEAIASEPPSGRRQRDLLENRIKKLKEGQGILRGVMRSAAS